MQWRNIRGYGDAYALDLLIARMQKAVLTKSGELADLKVDLMDRLAALRMHLNPVRQKEAVIRRVKSDEFWKQISVQALEEVRQPLREIMHHRERGRGTPLPPRIVDIIEDVTEVEHSRRSTSLKTVDMRAYKQIVEAELKKHFETDPTLRKIRAGQPVSEDDIESWSHWC